MPIRLRERIEARLAAIVGEMSQWVPGSLLSRYNRAPAGTGFVLPPDFATVLEAARVVGQDSGGAFDPTHGRAAALLGYGAEPMTRPPTDEDIQDARACAGWARLEYDGRHRRLVQPGGLWLDFSGIGKGFAVDAIADLLCAEGLEDVLVEIGGELVGRGLKPDGQPWWVDLETPRDGGRAPAPIRIGLHDLAVATSGTYVRGAHTLDPLTGGPVGNGIVAVSVLHRSAMLADAWATALHVLGPQRATEIAERHALAARILIDGGATELVTPALNRMM